MVTTGSSQNFKMDQVSLKRKFSLSLVFWTGLNWLGPNLNVISSMEEWTEPIQPTLEYLCFQLRPSKNFSLRLNIMPDERASWKDLIFFVYPIFKIFDLVHLEYLFPYMLQILGTSVKILEKL